MSQTIREAKEDQMSKPILFAIAFILGLMAGIMTDDFRARAVSDEVLACKDRPDAVAYYARKPGEGHNVETCVRMMRYGSPDWVPDFGHPLKPSVVTSTGRKLRH